MREMLRGGVQFGAHTRSHAALTTVAAGQAEDEVAGSRVDLERTLGRPILAFAYPHGKYDATRQAVVERAGFLGACCSQVGVNEPAAPPYALRRIEIRGTYPFVRFALALWLGLPWSLLDLLAYLLWGGWRHGHLIGARDQPAAAHGHPGRWP
jgi:peptidoglycan/xylan/chitin deacetylase (PgdA/CDA1 family)